jgi:hypothetical protein
LRFSQIASSSGAIFWQKGHSKSANSTTTTGASSGPRHGDPSSGMAFDVDASKRCL